MDDKAIDKSVRQDLGRRYAQGEMTIHELRRAGHWRMIALLSDPTDLGERQALAQMTGLNVAQRLAGLERLGAVLRRSTPLSPRTI